MSITADTKRLSLNTRAALPRRGLKKHLVAALLVNTVLWIMIANALRILL